MSYIDGLADLLLDSSKSGGSSAVPKNRVEVSIVIPALNEESRLPQTLMKTATYLAMQDYTSEILVVTDGSTDGTEAVVERASELYRGIKLLSLPQNRGKGFAVKYGMINALGAYRLFMNADNSVPIGNLGEFIQEIKAGADVVIGSRAHEKSFVLDQLQKAVLRLPYADTQCGFKLFTANAVKLLFPHLVYECAYFDTELLYIANKMKLAVSELPVSWTKDQTAAAQGWNTAFGLVQKMIAIPSLHSDKHQVFKTRVPSLEKAR